MEKDTHVLLAMNFNQGCQWKICDSINALKTDLKQNVHPIFFFFSVGIVSYRLKNYAHNPKQYNNYAFRT